MESLKYKFYIPKYKSEYVDFLAKHTRCKQGKLEKKTLDELRKHYIAVRLNWR